MSDINFKIINNNINTINRNFGEKNIRVSVLDGQKTQQQRKSIKFKTFPINFNIVPYYQENEKRKMDRKLIENSHKVFQNEKEGIYKDKYLTTMFNGLYQNDKNYIQKRKKLSKSLSACKKISKKNIFLPDVSNTQIVKNNSKNKIKNLFENNDKNENLNNNNKVDNKVDNKIENNNISIKTIKNINKYKIHFSRNSKPKLLKKNFSEFNLSKTNYKYKNFSIPMKIYFQ